MTVSRFRPARFLLGLFLAAMASLAGAQDPNNPLLNNQFSPSAYPGIVTPTPRGNPNYGNGSNNGNSNAPSNGSNVDNSQRLMQNNANGTAQGATPNDNQAGNLYRRPPPPPKPGEFQKFVESATGRLLPLFGSSFFNDAYDSYVPVDNVPVPGDYTVGPGDEVIIRAWGSIDIDYRTKVDRNGLLNLPKVGSFNVSGVKASDLEKSLRSQIGRLYTNFDLSVSLGQLRGVKVFVVGPAQRPGVVTLASQSTLLSAVVMAGGPSPSGSMRKVLLRRDGKIIAELDMYAFLVEGDKSKDVQLAAGDVVVFQPAGPRVGVTGALDTPAIYELNAPQESVRQVLRYAGGTPPLANPNLAQLERVDVTQRAARFVEEFKLDPAGLDKPLRDGDVLTLLPISPQFANAVTLRGHVAQPLRYPYTPGMRIRDLIPDREALITPDFYRRKNLLVQTLDSDARVGRNAGYGNNRGNGAPPGYGAATDGSRDAQNGGNGNVSNNSADNAGNPNPRNNSRALAAGTADSDFDNTDSYDANGVPRSRAERQRRSEDLSIVNASKRAPTPLFDELNWDYAVIERLNTHDLTTQVIPFNLGKAILQGDPANNIELMPGDVVTIYGQSDIRVPVSRQTRLISLEGEVGAPGVYQLQPGDTLQSIIARAGGFTPQAYVYGLEFSREETRQRQRENLVQAISRLEALSSVQAARDAANRRDDATGAATTIAVSNAATQAQLTRLRAVQPNGRIALELDPGSNSLASLPPVPLEGGDRIVVPPRPGFVTVAGAVVNSNAFLWRPGRTAGEYLKLAGADEAIEHGAFGCFDKSLLMSDVKGFLKLLRRAAKAKTKAA